MSCSSAVCCTNTCPAQAGVANGLGFSNGAPSCCRGPCPILPLHPVHICIQINNQTLVSIQRGCQPFPDSSSECTQISYGYAITENTWGRKCRVVEFIQKVPTGTFLKIVLCANGPCVTCDGDLSYVTGGKLKNQLLRFQVDGIDYVQYYQSLLDGTGARVNCSNITCGTLLGGDCCDDTFTDVGNLPIGTVIVYGPVGAYNFQSLAPVT